MHNFAYFSNRMPMLIVGHGTHYSCSIYALYFSLVWHLCLLSDGTQNLIFFVALYLTAVGCGGVRSALLPFGADQFNNEHSLDIKRRRNFFSSFYICVIFGVITSGTVIVWVQENVSWAIGYGIATTCIGLALIGFLVGTPHTYISTIWALWFSSEEYFQGYCCHF